MHVKKKKNNNQEITKESAELIGKGIISEIMIMQITTGCGEGIIFK